MGDIAGFKYEISFTKEKTIICKEKPDLKDTWAFDNGIITLGSGTVFVQ